MAAVVVTHGDLVIVRRDPEVRGKDGKLLDAPLAYCLLIDDERGKIEFEPVHIRVALAVGASGALHDDRERRPIVDIGAETVRNEKAAAKAESEREKMRWDKIVAREKRIEEDLAAKRAEQTQSVQ